MRISFEDIVNDPELVAKIRAQAQRERAEAVHRLIIAPILAFFRRRTDAARPHFARQG